MKENFHPMPDQDNERIPVMIENKPKNVLCGTLSDHQERANTMSSTEFPTNQD